MLGIDYGNGNLIQVEGYFKANINAMYKRKKKGKKCKFFKTESIPFCEMTFIGERIKDETRNKI